MSEIIRPGQGLLYMKVGTHAQEPIEEIFERKSKEIRDAGVAFWGYGGGTCHPETMVQPFAKNYERRGEIIYLCMERMDSRHFAEQIPADEYSVDGAKWEQVPPGIRVLGSRYALVVRNLRKAEFDLPLARTKVALGNSMGALGTRYIRGRVDKACLEITEPRSGLPPEDDKLVRIGLVADLVSPYAVYVRNNAKTKRDVASEEVGTSVEK
jgi:hypothetical protein